MIEASLPPVPNRPPLPACAARPPGAGLVQWVNPAQDPDWDARMAVHPGHTFFHSAAWARVLQSTYGFKPVYFTRDEPDGGRTVWPLMEAESRLTGRRGVALPFTDDCAPLWSGPDGSRNLVQSVIEYGRGRAWKHVEFRGGGEWFAGVSPSLSFHGHVLDLSGDEGALFARLESSVRRAIRKAEKEGVVVEFARSREAVETFYALHCETRKKHGTPPQPFEFFRKIHEHILARNLGMVALARHQGKPIAANMYFCAGSEAIYKFGASDERFLPLRGSNLVMWEAIKWHARAGARTMNLGRTSLANEGLRRFKLGWGSAEHRIDYFKYDLRTNRYVQDRDGATGWRNRVFSRLPVPLLRWIGARVVSPRGIGNAAHSTCGRAGGGAPAPGDKAI